MVLAYSIQSATSEQLLKWNDLARLVVVYYRTLTKDVISTAGDISLVLYDNLWYIEISEPHRSRLCRYCSASQA
jgi:hypothetical protein